MISTSRYALQLERYLEHFGRERILVVDFDEVRDEPVRALQRIGAFVGAPEGWDGIAAGAAAANAGGELARMPKWFFKVRKIRAVSDLRRHLPAGLAAGLRRALATGPVRDVPPVDIDLVARAADELRPDAVALRRATGLAFPSWSV